MEHNDAVRLQAVEKYILGELPPAVRDEFETHYFDCAVCSFNLRAGVAFAAGTRQLFTEAPVRAKSKPSAGWFSWLKPMIAVPVMAALLLVIGYQYSVGTQRSAPAVADWHSLVESNVKGPAGQTVHVAQGKPFSVFFDITAQPKSADSVFLVTLVDPTGKIVSSAEVSAQAAQKPVLYNVPAPSREGEFNLIISEKTAGATSPAGKVSFTVAFSSQIQQH